ncbi:MAG: SRPBCC family protein [Acidimicrobiales bacterium]
MTAINGNAGAEVGAGSEAVFAKITGLGELPSWNAVMTRVCEQPVRLEPGAQWVVEFHVLGRTWRSRSRCEAIDCDGCRFIYRTQTDDGNPSYATWEWTVTPIGARSRVEVSWELHPVTFWRRVLLAKVRNRQLARQEVPASLAALDRVLSGAESPA